jgi:hypothetical protein
MATPEEKERNRRLTQEALDRKHAIETKQTPNGKEHKVITEPDDTTTVSTGFGGLVGKAADALKSRRREP